MNDKITNAKSTIREAHSLLTLVAHSALDGYVNADGQVVIDAATIHCALFGVCRLLDQVDDELEDIALTS